MVCFEAVSGCMVCPKILGLNAEIFGTDFQTVICPYVLFFFMLFLKK